jgi:hypothetical protein
MSSGFATPLNAAPLVPGLARVAKALEAGDLSLANIALVQLGIPAFTSYADGMRAAATNDLIKAAPDDPEHPGWPKGAPDGEGGQFRPKDALPESPEARSSVKLSDAAKTALRQAARRAIRSAAIQALKIGGKLLLNVIPVVGEIADATTVYDVYKILEERHQFRVAADALKEYVDAGSHTLDQIRMSPGSESFDSFDAFKKLSEDNDDDLIDDILDKRFGNAGDGYAYHHIIEQGSGQPTNVVQNSDNIVRIPRILHEAISGIYNEPGEGTGNLSLREWLRTQPEEVNRERGLKVMRDVGAIK